MLTPREIDAYADAGRAAFDTLTDSILKDMARRIRKAGGATATSDWQAYRLKALGESNAHVQAELTRLMPGIAAQVGAIFRAAMIKADADDAKQYLAAGAPYTKLGDNAASQQLVNSGYRRTMNTLYNLTQTRAVGGNKMLGSTQQEQLAELLDQAHWKMTSGAFSPDEAIRGALRGLAEKGLGAITYPSGHRDQLEVVVRRAMVTGVAQTAGDVSLNNAQMMGVDLMELSAHAGARTAPEGAPRFADHSWWQGNIVSLSGADGYLSLDDIGYGDVQGFLGANCRHNWHPFFEGISQRAYTPERLKELQEATVPYKGKQIPRYQAEQTQRSLERSIRKCKREYLVYSAGGDKDMADAAAISLKRAHAHLADFLQETGLPEQPLREVTPGFGRSEAGKAAWSAKKHHQQWLHDIGAESTTESTLDSYYAGKYNNTEEHQLLMQYNRSIKDKKLSPLVGFEAYKNRHDSLAAALFGKQTASGLTIRGISAHFMERSFGGRQPDGKGKIVDRVGVATDSIINTVLRSTKTRFSEKNKTVVILGHNHEISVNPNTGNLIQVNYNSDVDDTNGKDGE